MKASLPRVPLTWRHDIRLNHSPAFCCSHNRPPACGLFPCARHRPRQPRTAVMFAADPAPVRYPASGLVPLKNAAWLSCAVREPTNIFQRGNDMATPHSKPATAFRSGNVNAAIWENTGEKGHFFSVTFSRPYKDAQGKWKTASSYGLNDLDALSSLAELAKDWVHRHSRP